MNRPCDNAEQMLWKENMLNNFWRSFQTAKKFFQHAGNSKTTVRYDRDKAPEQSGKLLAEYTDEGQK